MAFAPFPPRPIPATPPADIEQAITRLNRGGYTAWRDFARDADLVQWWLKENPTTPSPLLFDTEQVPGQAVFVLDTAARMVCPWCADGCGFDDAEFVRHRRHNLTDPRTYDTPYCSASLLHRRKREILSMSPEQAAALLPQ